MKNGENFKKKKQANKRADEHTNKAMSKLMELMRSDIEKKLDENQKKIAETIKNQKEILKRLNKENAP